jgi:hypothetical protein
VIKGDVPPVPKPVESLIMAANLERAGNGKVNSSSLPEVTVRSKMTLVSVPWGIKSTGTMRRV